IAVLETQNAQDFIDLQTKDTTIMKLQSEVKKMKKYIKNQGSVTIIKTETKYDTIYKTPEGNISGDCSTCNINDTISNKWINATYSFKPDSTHFTLSVVDDSVLTIGLE